MGLAPFSAVCLCRAAEAISHLRHTATSQISFEPKQIVDHQSNSGVSQRQSFSPIRHCMSVPAVERHPLAPADNTEGFWSATSCRLVPAGYVCTESRQVAEIGPPSSEGE